jgi:hypothetical protein
VKSHLDLLKIPHTKLQEVLSLCKIYFSKSKITKNQLQTQLGSFMFLHKDIKPAWLFINRILALLRDMKNAGQVAIDEGIRQDLWWFMGCSHAVYGAFLFISVCNHTCTIMWALGACVYTHTFANRPC